MSDHPLQPFVNHLLLRSPLSGCEQQALLSLPTQPLLFPSSHDLVALGEQTQSAYLVIEGVIGRFSQMRNGIRQIVAVHIAGDMADLCSAALPKTSWAFHALVPTSVMKISHADLIAVADRYPNIGSAFWRDCVADMAVMSEWLVSIARRTAEAKLAHLLCELHCRYRQAGLLRDDGAFTFPVTQNQISEILGITAIHVNRMIRSLRERGWVVFDRREIFIRDWPRLAKLAEFDRSYLHLDELEVHSLISCANGG